MTKIETETKRNRFGVAVIEAVRATCSKNHSGNSTIILDMVRPNGDRVWLCQGCGEYYSDSEVERLQGGSH